MPFRSSLKSPPPACFCALELVVLLRLTRLGHMIQWAIVGKGGGGGGLWLAAVYPDISLRYCHTDLSV